MDFQSPQNGMYDPSNFIDPNALANNQMNGTRQYPMSSIPQKRDSTGATLSRSQTPSQQPNFGFQQGFSHTPSPTMQNQNFRPGQMGPQRMQSPAQNPHAPQMSPMGFPQQGSPMPQGFDPNAGQYQGVQLSQNLQNRQQEAQRRYAMQLQAQAQQQQLGNLAASNMAAQQRHQAGQMPGVPGQHPGMQRNMMQGQMQNPQAQLQAFLKNVGALMQQHGRPFNPQPAVAGRPINLQQLYYAVMKMKGFRYVTSTNSWPRIAQVLGINYQQFPSAPEELRMIYEANLGMYETVYIAKQKNMQQNPMQGQMGGMGAQMSPTRPGVPGQQAPNPAQQEYLQQLQRSKAMAVQQRQPDPTMQQSQPQQQFDQNVPQQQPPPQQQFEQSTPVQNNVSLARVNGSSTPQADSKVAVGGMDHRKSASRQLEATPDRAAVPGVPTAPPTKQEEVPADDKKQDHLKIIDDVLTFEPRSSVLNRHTGVDFQAENLVKRVEELVASKPNMPSLMEMGVIDIRALTMSIRSGMHAEARLALDTLSKLTYEQTLQLELDRCEDLVEVLVDYAEDQLNILANDNPEVTDILDLTPYEDVMHNCRAEVSSLQEHPEFGTKEYDLERTADRLVAITTIFRNLSFLEINHTALTTTPVLKFFSNAIRLVGTRVLLLRSHVNTFDFMKDVVTFFSNTTTKIVLPSREDAYTILHFLCAFAPTPRPTTPVKFTPYNPKVHRYLPSAVDSLAKLLARDDPNRSFYKQIFVNEATSSPPYDLLTRAFALAIAVVPDRLIGRLQEASETRLTEVRMVEAKIAEARKPYLMQGMLAADILASLAPGPESGICRSWLESEDGWAASLLKFAMNLCATDAQFPPPQQDHRMQGRNQRAMDHDVQGYQLIVHRALSMLKRLGEKSKGGDVLVKGPAAQTNGHSANHVDNADSDDDDDLEDFQFGGNVWRVKADVLPKKETLLSALLTPSLDVRSLRQFCGIGYLDDMQ